MYVLIDGEEEEGLQLSPLAVLDDHVGAHRTRTFGQLRQSSAASWPTRTSATWNNAPGRTSP